MNTRIIAAAAIIFTVVVSASCRVNIIHGEGNKKTTQVTTEVFNSIDISVPAELTVQVQDGQPYTVKMEGYENLLAHLSAKVNHGQLILSSDVNSGWMTDDADKIKITVTTPSLSAFDASGATDAVIHGNLTGNDFKMELSGATKVIIDNVNVANFTSETSGASKIEINGGSVANASFEISGAGKLSAFPLQAKSVSIQISGAGKGQVTATEKLTAGVSGAASIRYKGHPVVTQDVSGAASIADAN